MRLSLGLYCLLILASACSPKLRTYSTQISVLPQTEEGTIYLRASGLGKDARKAYENTIYNALSTLLFQGVPESIQSAPIIPPEDAERMRPKVDKCLKDNGCYQNFITQITPPPGVSDKVQGGFSTSADIKVNLHALRSYLEQNNVIRKFGF